MLPTFSAAAVSVLDLMPWQLVAQVANAGSSTVSSALTQAVL